MSTELSEVDLIIVGAGLAGMAAAITASDAATAAGIFLRILLLEKQTSAGGNSAKASSGMNAAVTSVQIAAKIADSVESFYKDTIASGDGLSIEDLVQVLTKESAEAWEFLSKNGIDLKKLSKCGGHSFARTHRQEDNVQEKPTNVGYYITSSLAKIIGERKGLTLQTGAKVTELLTEAGKVTGVKYTHDGGEAEVKAKAVILASGGYGGDFSETSYLKQYHPLAYSLCSTNGKFAAGEGITIAKRIGAGTIHMDKVQIHPTSFIDPKSPFDKTKFLAAEALRGHGGILLNQKGLRFVNELDRRDVVTHAIFDNCEKEYDEEKKNSQHVSFLVLNEEAKKAFGSGFGFYLFKGFFKKYDNLAAFRTEYKIVKTEEVGFGAIPFTEEETVYVSKITPAVHYTMGGLKMTKDAEILTDSDAVIPGLFGAGEVTGGVHGENRLAGNSLLECVVFGRKAGTTAFQFAVAASPLKSEL